MVEVLDTDKWNKLLPYETDKAADVFANIKTNISQAVQQRDLTRGLKFWSDQLSTFVKIYGFQIEKSDLISLVKLYYSLLIQDDINIPVVATAGKSFILLLSRQKVKKAITREELVLDWRPLYSVTSEILYGKEKYYNLKHGYIHLEGTIRNVIATARDYFSDDSTQDMLDEWEPMLCPQDSMTHRGTTFLSLFLPVTVSRETGFGLWIDRVLGLVKSISVSFRPLLSRVAKFNVGKIDWKPHIPWIFNMILHDLNLPVGESHTFAGCPLPASKACLVKTEILVWMMGENTTDMILEHLEILAKIFHSFIHPSNRGKWTFKLISFVNNLCQMFLKRVEMEKNDQGCWYKQIPTAHQLSQDQIDRFVRTMLPIVKLSMFNSNSNNFQHDYQCLVRLSPSVVLPDFLEHAFDSIESVVEPQRVTTALCSFAVSLRALCLHEPSKQDIVPLLQSLLPTISSNDLTKSWIALLAFSFAFTMIPIVDCSHLLLQPGPKRTRKEETVLRSTAQFKDMVAVFVDKLMGLIEVSAMEDTGNENSVNTKGRTSKSIKNASSIPDYLAEGSIYMSFDSLLRNSSDDIRDMILDKVFRFVTNTTLEVKVAGKTMGDALSNLSNTYTEKTLKKFVPYLLREIEALLESETEKGDTSAELLWNVTMLRSVLRGRGDCFLPYLGDIQDLIEKCLQFHNSRQLIGIVVKAISDILYLLRNLKTLEFKSCEVSYEDKEFDFTTTWGKGFSVGEVNLEWYKPGPAEYQAIIDINNRFGVSAMETLKRYVDEGNTCKEMFQVQLRVLDAITRTAGSLMPMMGSTSPLMTPKYGGQDIDMSARVPILNLDLQTGVARPEHDTLLFSFRERAAGTVKTVYDYIHTHLADDAKSFEIMCGLLENILTHKGCNGTKMKKEHTKYKSVKQMLDDKLQGKKKQLRMVLIHRIYLQQHYRQHSQLSSNYTDTHHMYTQCLVDMAVSNYTEVRIAAQCSLRKCLSVMMNSKWFFVPKIVKYLDPTNKEITHEQLKGAIYCLSMARITSYFSPQPLLYCDVLPAICRTQHSEKDSIINAIEDLTDRVLEEYRTTSFTTKVSDRSLAAAEALYTKAPDSVVAAGLQIAQLKDRVNREGFESTIGRLVGIMKTDSTTWRFLDLTGDVVKTLMQKDMRLSPEFVSLFLGFLTHDSFGLRLISLRVVGDILYLRRKQYKETELDPRTFADDGPGPQAGERPSNMWLQYKESDLPDTEEKWNNFIFVDKPHVGYNRWAKKLKVCIEVDHELGNEDRYNEIDRLIVNKFKDPAFITRFIELNSLEDNKGEEKPDFNRRIFYRDLFRNYGWALFEQFRPKVEEFVTGKVEAQHRFASELLCSVTRGSKHWPYKDIQLMWDTILPLIEVAMRTVSLETLQMWVVTISGIVEDRDPRRFYRLVQLAKGDTLLSDSSTIFHKTSKLCLMEIIVAQFEWKYAEGLDHLLEDITDNLNNNYKNVRDKLGQLIDRCTAHDTLMYECRETVSPRKSAFMERALPLMASLDEGLFGTEWVVVNKPSLSDDNDAIKVVKTITSWLLYSRMLHGHGKLFPGVFPFLSYLIALEPQEVDPDLKHLSTKALFSMSREVLHQPALQPAIDALKKVICSTSEERATGCTWKAKCTALVYLQVMAFCNLFNLRSHPQMIQQIQELLFICLESPHVEVRQVAGQSLGGLMRTTLFHDTPQMIELLSAKAKTPLPKGTKKSQTDIREIWVRHGAVKTLCALVESFPYSIPDFIPQILVFLSNYMRGNVMIANEVKKSMANFKRTHQDSWEEHKRKFTEEQLGVLEDLLVSPNYYA